MKMQKLSLALTCLTIAILHMGSSADSGPTSDDDKVEDGSSSIPTLGRLAKPQDISG